MRRTEALASVKFYQILSIFIFFIRLIILEDFIRLISYNGPCVRLGCSFFLATALISATSWTVAIVLLSTIAYFLSVFIFTVRFVLFFFLLCLFFNPWNQRPYDPTTKLTMHSFTCQTYSVSYQKFRSWSEIKLELRTGTAFTFLGNWKNIILRRG